MIDLSSVITLFRERYAGGSDDVIVPLCVSACREVESMLQSDDYCNDIRIAGLAAAIANYRMCLKNLIDGDGVTSFKAGDVTVDSNPEMLLKIAEKELESAKTNAGAMLKGGFYFGQVRV